MISETTDEELALSETLPLKTIRSFCLEKFEKWTYEEFLKIINIEIFIQIEQVKNSSENFFYKKWPEMALYARQVSARAKLRVNKIFFKKMSDIC